MMAMVMPYLFFITVALCVYANALGHPFVHDDIAFIVNNPNIARFDDWFSIFLTPMQAVFDGTNPYYRPILEYMYRLEYAAFGFAPFGWHLFNVLLHGVNGALVYALIKRLGFAQGVAGATALLFTVHPIQTESVTCVAGISNVLMGFFVLACLITYVNQRNLASLVFFILALLTKEQSLMVIPLIMLIDAHKGKKHYFRWGVFVAGALALLSWRHMVTGTSVIDGIFSFPGELRLRLLNIAQVVLTDLRILFLPLDLHYYRCTDILATYGIWWLGLFVLILVLWRFNQRWLWFGMAFFILALLPVLNIVPLVNEYSFIQAAEHFLYIPMIGIMLVLVNLVRSFCRAHTEQVILIFVTCFFFLSVIQNEFWQNEVVLFERTVTYEPEFGRGHLLLAQAYFTNEDYSHANEHFAKAYAIMDGYYLKAIGDGPKHFYNRFKKGILFHWAQSFEKMGNLDMARQKHMQATAIDPGQQSPF